MPSDRAYRRLLQVYFTEKEWQSLSAEAYSREISRGEMIRRALTHFCECQTTAIEKIVPPPKGWHMGRAAIG